MYEYKKNDNVVVKSHGSKNVDFSSITIEVIYVPFMCGWRNGESIPTLDNMVDVIINHFGSLSAEIYTEIVIAYKRAIDEVK